MKSYLEIVNDKLIILSFLFQNLHVLYRYVFRIIQEIIFVVKLKKINRITFSHLLELFLTCLKGVKGLVIVLIL